MWLYKLYPLGVHVSQKNRKLLGLIPSHPIDLNLHKTHIVCILTCMYTYMHTKKYYAVYIISKISDIIYGMYMNVYDIYPFALNCCFNFRLPSLRSGSSDVAAPESSESYFNTVTVLMNA